MFSLCSCGFSLGAPVSSHHQSGRKSSLEGAAVDTDISVAGRLMTSTVGLRLCETSEALAILEFQGTAIEN